MRCLRFLAQWYAAYAENGIVLGMNESIQHTATARLSSEILKVGVDRRTVGETYLASELHKIFRWEKDELAQHMQAVTSLTDEDFYKFLEALSFTYRLNGVFYRVGSEKYTWVEAIVPIEDLTLTGINPAVDAVVQRSDIQHHPVAFANFLKEHFQEHEDPSQLPFHMLLPDESVDLENQVLFAQEKHDQIRMFDGGHRLLAMAQLGIESCRMYIAISKENAAQIPQMRGPAVFLHLRKAFEAATDPEVRSSIVTVCRELVATSSDGEKAVHTYWIEYAQDDEVRAAGQSILG